MPEPYAWLTTPAVAAQLGLPDGSALSTQQEQARLAAGAYVERARADLTWVDPLTLAGVTTTTGDVLAGAALLSARLAARTGSPLGVAAFGEFGPAAVIRLDPDVERLLGLGRYAKPRIG